MPPLATLAAKLNNGKRKMSVLTTDDQAVRDGDCTHALRTSRQRLHLASGGGHAHFRSLDSRRFAAGGVDSFVATQEPAARSECKLVFQELPTSPAKPPAQGAEHRFLETPPRSDSPPGAGDRRFQ